MASQPGTSRKVSPPFFAGDVLELLLQKACCQASIFFIALDAVRLLGAKVREIHMMMMIHVDIVHSTPQGTWCHLEQPSKMPQAKTDDCCAAHAEDLSEQHVPESPTKVSLFSKRSLPLPCKAGRCSLRPGTWESHRLHAWQTPHASDFLNKRH